MHLVAHRVHNLMSEQVQQLGVELRNWLLLLCAGKPVRPKAAQWAASQLKLVPSAVFDSDPYGQLIEYALGRLIDDDWTPAREIEDEWRDLLSRMADAEHGIVRLP